MPIPGGGKEGAFSFPSGLNNVETTTVQWKADTGKQGKDEAARIPFPSFFSLSRPGVAWGARESRGLAEVLQVPPLFRVYGSAFSEKPPPAVLCYYLHTTLSLKGEFPQGLPNCGVGWELG